MSADNRADGVREVPELNLGTGHNYGKGGGETF